MSDQRRKQRSKSSSSEKSTGPDAFVTFGLSAADFEIDSGGGKSFLSGQRVVWLTIRHRSSGRTVSGKIGTSKKGAESKYNELLKVLLKSFRKS